MTEGSGGIRNANMQNESVALFLSRKQFAQGQKILSVFIVNESISKSWPRSQSSQMSLMVMRPAMSV